MTAGVSHRLVVVSNRLPFTLRRTSGGTERRPSLGGLVAALNPTLARLKGVWVGWPGVELRSGETIARRADPYRIRPVALSPREVAQFYSGFSNRTLWPLFHSFPARSGFERKEWDTYDQVNARFAHITAAELRSDDLVWVHDYQLMRMPLHLRTVAPEARIGFFLHIPFPPYDVFRILPRERELLRGVLAADLIGFHVEGYLENFLDCVERVLGAAVNRDTGVVQYEGHSARVGAFPLGIDFEHYEHLARTAPLTRGLGGRIVLGVDRLDYTKGLPERIRAFEHLLEKHPEHRERTVLVQVAVPSRSEVPEYEHLKDTMDQLVGRATGRFATADWAPIRYLYRALPQERLAGLYRDADVALVTPLRDGMNLVAKEFVACQVGNPGVLVLSRLTGAAETMREAVPVNPYDIEGTAAALHTALAMDAGERARRMTALRDRERATNVHAWARSFLDTLATRP